MPSTPTPQLPSNPLGLCAACLRQFDLTTSFTTADSYTLCPHCATRPAGRRCPICHIPHFVAPDNTICDRCFPTAHLDEDQRSMPLLPPPPLSHSWSTANSITTYPGDPCPTFALNRLVGLEIEALHPTSDRPNALRPFGHLKYDGSIRAATANRARHAFELATHPCSGDMLEAFLQDLCKTLAHEHVEVNSSCGLHIHVSMAQSTLTQRTNLSFWWAIFEDLFFAIQPAARRNSQYCQPVSSLTSMDSWADNRYAALNTSAYNRHSTFEWRLGAGTTSHSSILTQVQLILAFIKTYEDMPALASPDDPYYQSLLAMDDRTLLQTFLKSLALPFNLTKRLLRAIKLYHGTALLTPGAFNSLPSQPALVDTFVSDDDPIEDEDDDHYDDDDENEANN